jgi:hypothetical protein
MSKLHKLQQYQAIDHKGFKTESSLYNLYMKRPEYLSLSSVMLSDNEREASLVRFYNKFPTMNINSENEMVKWRVSGRGSQNCILEEVITEGGVTMTGGSFPAVIGSGRVHFYMIFDKPLFSQTQIIKNQDDSAHFQIHEEKTSGGKTMYEVSLVNDNYDLNVSSSKIAIGSRFNVIGGMVADHLSDKGMKPVFTSEYEMAIRGGKFRMQYEVSGAMIEQGRNYPLQLPFRIPTANGKVVEVSGYINAMDQACLMQSEVLKAKASLYGKKNWLTDGTVLDLTSNGQFQVPSIMGLFEQIAPGNRHYYNKFDLDWLTDLILSKQIAKKSRNNRRVKLVTGEFGAKAFHEAVDAKVGATTPTLVMGNQFIQGASASNTGAQNALSFGYQYTQYRAVNGLEFEVEIADWMDDNEFFPEMHPTGLGTKESYRYLIMPESNSGIYKLKPNNSQLPISKVIPGLRDPFTAGGKGFTPLNIASSSVDGYEVHHMDYMGLVMTDPEAIIDLRLV